MSLMTTYLLKFSVYLLAMTGAGFVAYIVWKQVSTTKSKSSKTAMEIEDCLNLSPRKSLFVVKVKNERFLIASDIDKTTFLAKLNENEVPDLTKIETKEEIKPQNEPVKEIEVQKEVQKELDIKKSFEETAQRVKKNVPKKEILEKTFENYIEDVKDEDIEQIKEKPVIKEVKTEKPVNILRELTRKRSA